MKGAIVLASGAAALALYALTRRADASPSPAPAKPRPKPPGPSPTPPGGAASECDDEYARLARGEGSDADLVAWYQSCGQDALEAALVDGRCDDIRTITEAFAALSIEVAPALQAMLSDSGCAWTDDGQPALTSDEEYALAQSLYARAQDLLAQAVDYESQHNARVEAYNDLISRRDSGPCREAVVDPQWFSECAMINDQIAGLSYEMQGLLGLRDEKMAMAASLKAQADAIMTGLGEM